MKETVVLRVMADVLEAYDGASEAIRNAMSQRCPTCSAAGECRAHVQLVRAFDKRNLLDWTKRQVEMATNGRPVKASTGQA